ncbi:MAG: hypothetical protein JO152_05535 [Mycobacteriaceae bacterium]|nr:hypothetical protein [Mycobacteriaceae bacterium]
MSLLLLCRGIGARPEQTTANERIPSITVALATLAVTPGQVSANRAATANQRIQPGEIVGEIVGDINGEIVGDVVCSVRGGIWCR